MHYYQHNIKDYKADAGYLSLIEDAVYRRLLDIYYLEESELVNDVKTLCVKVGAKTEECAAVEKVLGLFFKKTSKGYKNNRCDEEIKHYHSKSEKARASVKKRYTNVVRSKNERSTIELLTNNKEPRTNNDGGLPPISPPYPSPKASGSLADAQEKPKSVPEIARMRDEIRKKKTPTLGVLLILFALLLLAKPTYAAKPQKIVVRYMITSTNGHKLKPTAHTVAGGIGRGTSTSIPASPTSSASQKPKPSPYPREMGGGEKALAGSVKDRVLAAGVDRFGEEHTSSLEALVMHESGFNQYAGNKSSGACGLFQAMPCEKMGCQLDDVQCQIDWGFGYIERRYGNPTKAWDFWQSRRPISGRDVGNWY